MKEFPKNIVFKYKWRNYQQKVLEQLNTYTADNHLHVIAPPGAGKTVLGLEVALRFNKPTVIFAPTVAIKNQWITRFCELFLQSNNRPDWISENIKKPAFLTVSTYQGLYAACIKNGVENEELLLDEDEEDDENDTKKEPARKIEIDEIVKLLKKQNVGTFVLDEAHHLKNEWWKTLTAITEKINPTIVGLTATPPYDVKYVEWQRYLELNGSIDTEISVPELVVENDLCPHQDFVHLSEPTEEEKKYIKNQKDRISQVFNELKTDEKLIEAVQNHSAFTEPLSNLEWIYSNLESYSSMIVYLNGCGKEIPDVNLEVIGNKNFRIPKLDHFWMEKLLTFYIFTDSKTFVEFEEHQEKIANKLIRSGILERKTIGFEDNQNINKQLVSSLNKLKSIEAIVDTEYKSMKNSLRMVILTDYIRKEFLVESVENNLTVNKIGVVPIFELLRRKKNQNFKIGVLSGSLIIIPKSAFLSLKNLTQKHSIDNDIEIKELSYDSNYLIINVPAKLKHSIVSHITDVFESGEINILIGTKSLLGEGWDAPSINSIILASFVGSFVLSNQMRGRAIRTDKRNPEKTGNIWHLVCADQTDKNGGSDVELLKKRFRGFVGLSFYETPTIENGVNRLLLPTAFSKDEIETYNHKMISEAAKRDILKVKWKQALENGNVLVEEIKVPFPEEEKAKKEYREIKSMYFNKTIAFTFGTLISSLISFGQGLIESFLRSLKNITSFEDFLRWLYISGIIGLFSFGFLAYKTLKMYIKYRDIAKDFQQIGEVLLNSLIKNKIVKTDISKLEVDTTVDQYGTLFCHLKGGTSYEKSIFIKSLQEIVEPINNPRYIITRTNLLLEIVKQTDYHSVPEIIGLNKKSAEYFATQWSLKVTPCQLIYTKNLEGRKLLLKSRLNSLSSEFQSRSERINKWEK